VTLVLSFFKEKKMKRNIFITIIMGSLLLSSCYNQLNQLDDISSGGEQTRETAKSSANIKIFIPDYRKLAEQNNSRIIAPQTVRIRLSIADEFNTYVQHGELLEIDPGSIIPVDNAPANMPGGIWSGTFTSLECKVYGAGSLQIELLDQTNRVITRGTNQVEVVVYPFQTAQAVFFTTPEKFNNISGSLSSGEMKFWRVTMMGGYSYKLTLSAEGSYPDIVVFNDNGTFREYYSVSSSADGVIIFDPASTNNCYLGVWADNGAVSAYSVALSYNFSATQDFSGNNFNGWSTTASGIGASPPVIVVEDGKSILEFNSSPPMNNGGRVILSRTVTFTEPTAFSYRVKTDIGGSAVSTFFKIYINSSQKASYDGLEAAWNADTVIIPAGTHEIK
jgi:predicted small secreted protein